MARNHKFFFDAERVPRARGPAAEKILMTFLETDVQGSDHVCHDLMDDLIAVEDGSDDQREFVGNAHRVTIDRDGVTIEPLHDGDGKVGDAAADGPVTDGLTADASAADGSVTDGSAADAPAADGPAADGSTAGSRAADGSAKGGGTTAYRTGRKHFREVLEDWEAFILDDELADDSLLDDDFA